MAGSNLHVGGSGRNSWRRGTHPRADRDGAGRAPRALKVTGCIFVFFKKNKQTNKQIEHMYTATAMYRVLACAAVYPAG